MKHKIENGKLLSPEPLAVIVNAIKIAKEPLPDH